MCIRASFLVPSHAHPKNNTHISLPPRPSPTTTHRCNHSHSDRGRKTDSLRRPHIHDQSVCLLENLSVHSREFGQAACHEPHRAVHHSVLRIAARGSRADVRDPQLQWWHMQAKNFRRRHGLPTDRSAGVSLRAPFSPSDQRSRWLSCDVECDSQNLSAGSKGPRISGSDFASKTFMANNPGSHAFGLLYHLKLSQIVAGMKSSLSSLAENLHRFTPDEPVRYAV